LIQRGRGAGFLWAREHPDEGRSLLYSCLDRDPRSTCDNRIEYCVELARAVAFDVRALTPLLEAKATQPRWRRSTRNWQECNDLALTCLVGVALAGDPTARELVVGQILATPIWVAILEHVLSAYTDFVESYYKAFPDLPPWPELTDAVVARVWDQDRVAEIAAALSCED
jgi:hypothetical protein